MAKWVIPIYDTVPRCFPKIIVADGSIESVKIAITDKYLKSEYPESVNDKVMRYSKGVSNGSYYDKFFLLDQYSVYQYRFTIEKAGEL